MGAIRVCADCRNGFPRPETRCPHCARPGLFPNVDDASDPVEREALDRRHEAALVDAEARRCRHVAYQFEAECGGSLAVIARDVIEVHRLAASDRHLYATHYQWLQGGLRIPDGGRWDSLRRATDAMLFGPNMDEIRFAALSLDGVGLENYGACSLVLRDEMIAHRASVFDENSVKFMQRRDLGVNDSDDLPAGFRAPWADRARLCVAKLAAGLDAATQPREFPAVLLKPGPTSDGDDFVEVHVFGPVTIRTFQRLTVRRELTVAERVILEAAEAELSRAGYDLRVEIARWTR